MICPNCLIQMHQWQEVGAGESTDEVYTTWEIKVCDNCGRKVMEFYSANLITDQDAEVLKETAPKAENFALHWDNNVKN